MLRAEPIILPQLANAPLGPFRTTIFTFVTPCGVWTFGKRVFSTKWNSRLFHCNIFFLQKHARRGQKRTWNKIRLAQALRAWKVYFWFLASTEKIPFGNIKHCRMISQTQHVAMSHQLYCTVLRNRRWQWRQWAFLGRFAFTREASKSMRDGPSTRTQLVTPGSKQWGFPENSWRVFKQYFNVAEMSPSHPYPSCWCACALFMEPFNGGCIVITSLMNQFGAS